MNSLETYLDTEMNLEKIREDSSRVMASYSKVLEEYYKELETVNDQVQQLKEENEELRGALTSLSLYVSAGIGDESTTAQQYLKRIKEGIVRLAADSKG